MYLNEHFPKNKKKRKDMGRNLVSKSDAVIVCCHVFLCI